MFKCNICTFSDQQETMVVSDRGPVHKECLEDITPKKEEDDDGARHQHQEDLERVEADAREDFFAPSEGFNN